MTEINQSNNSDQPTISIVGRSHFDKRHQTESSIRSWFVGHQADRLLDIKPGSQELKPFQQIETRQCGQDAILVIRGVDNNPNQMVVAVADGHGEMGHLFSYAAIRVLAREMLERWELLKTTVAYPDTEAIEYVVQSIYLQTHDYLFNQGIFPALAQSGGTTMAMAVVLELSAKEMLTRGLGSKAKQYLVSTNAGDSQILLSREIDQVTECSMDHNCDNPQAVRLYLQRLAKERQAIHGAMEELEPDDENYILLQYKLDELQPLPVYFSRINCFGGPTWNMYLDSEGKPEPIPVFRYTGPDQDDLELDTEGYEKVSRFFPHGTQSVRYPETYIREDGRRVAVAGSESDNWGSTLKGKCQTLNGFGDLEYSPHCSHEPHVSVHEINGPVKLVVATDGLTDLYHFKDLTNWFHQVQSLLESKVDSDFWKQLFKTADPHTEFTYAKVVDVNYPQWDDVSGVFVDLPTNPDNPNNGDNGDNGDNPDNEDPHYLFRMFADQLQERRSILIAREEMGRKLFRQAYS